MSECACCLLVCLLRLRELGFSRPRRNAGHWGEPLGPWYALLQFSGSGVGKTALCADQKVHIDVLLRLSWVHYYITELSHLILYL